MLPGKIVAKKNKLDLDEVIESMIASVLETAQAEQVWRVLIDPTMHSEFQTQFNMYSSFFLSTSRSAFSTVIMGLSRLSDSHNSAMNIPKFLDLISNDSNSNAVEKLKEKYSQLDEVWSKLKHVRHGVYAHISASSTEKNSFKRAGITPNEISEAVRSCTEILFEAYELAGKNSDPLKSRDFDSMHELKKLFQNLKAGREARLRSAEA